MTKLFKILKGAKNHLPVMEIPVLKHTWKHTLALYPSTKSKKPIFSVTTKNDKTVSVLKLALILLGGIFAAVFIATLIKRIRKRLCTKKRKCIPQRATSIAYIGDTQTVSAAALMRKNK